MPRTRIACWHLMHDVGTTAIRLVAYDPALTEIHRVQSSNRINALQSGASVSVHAGKLAGLRSSFANSDTTPATELPAKRIRTPSQVAVSPRITS